MREDGGIEILAKELDGCYPLECYHGSILFEPAVSRLAEIIQETIDSHSSMAPGGIRT